MNEAILYNVFIRKREFKLFSQSNGKDCGDAVLSMVLKRFVTHYPGGMSIANMTKLCEKYCISTSSDIYKGTRHKLRNRISRGIFLIREHGKPYGHWILIDKYHNIYDSELICIDTPKGYERKDWEVIAKINIKRNFKFEGL